MAELNLIPISEWKLFPECGPLVVAGPCSAESPEQLMRTADALGKVGVRVFRAGVWKPRSHPQTFEGAGDRGLEWLAEVKRASGMSICTEVATAEHVRACMENGIDAVWIGARTTANPFLVQGLADALSGTDIPVFVKNPVNPDVELWSGALERLNRAGVRKLAAVHRGFSTVNSSEYRNEPLWTVALQLRSRYPRLPMFCDPSHMGGKSAFVKTLSQKALDLGYEGLMVEAHCCPQDALSDADQQLTPEELRNLLESVCVRKADSEEARYRLSVDELRSQIDTLDESILELISSRMKASREIGRLKLENNIAILQPDRWGNVLKKAVVTGRELNLDETFVKRIMALLHEASVEEQNKIISKDDSTN